MAKKLDDGTCVCDCGREFESSRSIASHGGVCDEYTVLRTEKVCIECGIEFSADPSKDTKFCSRECMGENMENKIERECLECGKQFTTTPSRVERGWGKHCSRQCNGKGQRKREETECLECGETFNEVPSVLKDGYGKYCGWECKLKGQTDNVTRICSECGEEFSTFQSEVNKGKAKYCSMECYSESGRVKRECQECGKKFTAMLSNVQKGNGKYCGMECYIESRTIPEKQRRDDYYGPLWNDRRQKAIVRDNYQCQNCGLSQSECNKEYDVGLHVHHKIPYRKFDTDKKAHRIENLITLCPPCHVSREPEIDV